MFVLSCLEVCVVEAEELAVEGLRIVDAGVPEQPYDRQSFFEHAVAVFGWQSEGCLIHGIASAQSKEDSTGILCGKRRECLSDNCGVSADEICDCYSYSDPSGVGCYRGQCGEWFRRRRLSRTI